MLQVLSLTPAALDCLAQQMQQQQQQQQQVFPASATSAVYVHPVSLKVHLLRLERPLPFLDVLVVGAPFREGPRGASEQQQLAAIVQGAPHLRALVIRGDGRWLQRLSAACIKSKGLYRLIIEDIYSLEGPRGAPCSSSSSSCSSSSRGTTRTSSTSSSSSSGSRVESVIALYVKTVAAMPRGSSISIRCCGLGLKGFEFLLQQLQRHSALYRRLKEMDVCYNEIPEEGGPLLSDFLSKGGGPPLLQQLRLGGNSWGPRALEGRLKPLGAPLKELSLQGALGLGPPPLQGAGPPGLGALWLGSSEVSVRVLKRLLLQQTARGALLHLDLSHCSNSLAEPDVAALLEALYSSSSSSSTRSKRSSGITGSPGEAPGAPLRSLNLAGNGLGAPVLHAVGGALRAPNCRLKSLDLSGNPCGVQTADDEEGPIPLQPLVDALQVNPKP